MSHSNEAGFSAAELLITLFIGVAFIIAGYQLYSVVINDSAEVRLHSTANNIAYHHLRVASANVDPTCSTSGPTTTTITDDYLPPTSQLTITRTCPFGTSSAISKVVTRVTYGSEEVSHAAYAVYNK